MMISFSVLCILIAIGILIPMLFCIYILMLSVGVLCFSVFIGITIPILIFKSSKKIGGTYSAKGLWFIYWTRWLWHAVLIFIWQTRRPKRMNDYKNPVEYESCGIVPNELDISIESPQSLLTDRHDDGMLIWGGDKEGRTIFAKIVRLSRRRASVIILVKNELKDIYTLPNQPDSYIVNVENDECWKGSGLFLECVEPMRTWRLKFNGLLRKGIKTDYETYLEDSEDDDAEDKFSEEKSPIIHVRLDFLWKAMRAPIDLWRDSSCSTLAHALAAESNANCSTFESLERDGYDQWGALHGNIKIGDNPSQEWYLRGSRQHRWGMSDSASNLRRSVNVCSYFSNGDVLWLEGFSFSCGIGHCVMGYIETASGYHLPITWSSLELDGLENEIENTRNIFIECQNGKDKKIHLWNQLLEEVPVYTGDPWKLKHNIRPTFCASNIYGEGWGVVVLSERFSGLCPVPEKKCFCLPSSPKLIFSENFFVVSLSDTIALDVPLCGGKGASLARLMFIQNTVKVSDYKFTVPFGVIITTYAWFKLVEERPEIKSAIICLEKAVGSSVSSRIKEASSKILNLIESTEIIEQISISLNMELTKLFPETLNSKRFAVRSSARNEDSGSASSAGQNKTYLGCFWHDGLSSESNSIARAIAACWASQFSFESIEYKRQRGQQINDGMSVVVQEMIPAESAGVMFTRETVTGNPEFITICANYGLGETVVSASVEPDTVLIKRTWRNKLKIHSRKIGEKKFKCVMKDIGGTNEINVSEENQTKLSITDSICLKLAEVGLIIEEYFGSPRDIEFAIVQDKIFLLQSRPLTFLEDWTDYELIHELDCAFISNQEILTIANVGEVLNGYICPLTLSSVVKSLDISFQIIKQQFEWPCYIPDFNIYRSITSALNHCFINVPEIMLRKLEVDLSVGAMCRDLTIFGHVVITQQMHKWAVHRYGAMSGWDTLMVMWKSIVEILLSSRRVNGRKSYFSNYEIDLGSMTSAKNIYDKICSKFKDLLMISQTHGQSSGASSLSQIFAFITIAGDAKEPELTVVQDITSLLSCMQGTESVDVPTSLKDVARTTAGNEEVEEFLQMTPDEGKVWLQSHPGDVGVVFRSFLQRHGHRCIKEFDLRSASWGMSPEVLVTTIQTMIRNPISYKKSKEINNIESALDKLKSPVIGGKRTFLKFLLRFCESTTSNRECTKSMLIKTVDAFRKSYRTLGQAMVKEHRLPDAELIFFLHHWEIKILLENRRVDLVFKAIRRRKLMTELEKIKFPEICIGVPIPLRDEAIRCNRQARDKCIYGTPVCQGRATGTVRVVESLQEASKIENGDILVTFSTDIGWTPYFPLLAGIITEIGGLISHGAVVAREYGLPCVIAVKGACQIFVSGEIVTIDGGEGFIVKEDYKTKS